MVCCRLVGIGGEAVRFYAQSRWMMWALPTLWGLTATGRIADAVRRPGIENDLMAVCNALLFGMYFVTTWLTYWELAPEGLMQRNIKGVLLIPYSNIVNVSKYVRADGKVADGCIQVDAPFGQRALVKPVDYRLFAEALEKRVDTAVMHI